MSRSRRRHAAVLAVALSGLIAAIAGGDSNALGPVIAITPFEVTPQFTEGNQPVISGRGETVGVFDQELNRVSFVQLDQPGPDGNISGRSITVSGNNCVALWTGVGNGAQTVIGLIDRCQPANTRVLFTLGQTFPMAQAALSFDGGFAALQIGGSPNTVYRIDTTTIDVVQMPTAGLPGFDTEADRGIDISDDGNIIVVAIRENFVIGFRSPASPAPSVLGTDNRDTFVAAWDVAAGQSTVVSTADGSMNGSSAYPSVSGDGRYVAFAADRPRVGGETSRGPWVYVRDRASSAFVRISDPAGSAFYTSISRDATQVAFGGYVSAPTPCVINDLIEFQCPPDRINVAYGSSPGLGGGFQTETVSVGAAGEIGGGHYEPSLSGNGRWIAWRSDIGDLLVGSKQGLQGRMHAFTRRRDPGMSVDALDFGTITVSTSVTLTTTVRNTGRTTNSIDSLIPAPGSFTVQPGGSCFVGMTLPPGGSCTVNIRFAAPAAATTVNGTLVAAEAGYDPISATGTLIGRSTTGPTIPPAVTTTTTTLPPGSGTPRPTTTTTTTTTIPKNLFLDAAPNPIDFGQVAIGIPTAPQTITVTNTGNTSGQLFVSIFGDHPDDFEIVGSTCEELILAPAATCTIEIRMNARDGGDRTALATITTSVGTVEVVLRGQGRFSPRLAASPQAVTDRAISTIIGQGYPPNDPVLVQIVGTPVSFNVTADAAGMFRIAFSPLGKLSLGSYTLHVDALPTVYELIETPLVVVLPTFKPQGPTGPAFGTSLLVTRGG